MKRIVDADVIVSVFIFDTYLLVIAFAGVLQMNLTLPEVTQMNHYIGDARASACQIWQPLLATIRQFPTCFSFKHQRIC